MPNGALTALPLEEERSRIAALRASQREARGMAAPEPQAPPSLDEETEIAAEGEAGAARLFETERLAARRAAVSRTISGAQSGERIRKEIAKRTAQWTIRIVNELVGEVALSETIIMPFISFGIMNLQLVAVNILRGGESLKVPGFDWLPGAELPPLDWWEIVLVLFIDFVGIPLLVLLNPFTLPILVVVILAGGWFSFAL